MDGRENEGEEASVEQSKTTEDGTGFSDTGSARFLFAMDVAHARLIDINV